MKIFSKNILFLMLYLLTTLPAMAQEEETDAADSTLFIIEGQVRMRGEYRHGNLVPIDKGQKAVGFINERARLSLGYQSQNVSLKISGQHVGVWGEQSVTNRSGNFVLNEAWGQLNSNDKQWILRLGRQVLAYDDERIFGTNDWDVAGNSHNMALIGYEGEQHRLHLFGAFNQNEETQPSDYCPTYYNPTATGLYKHIEGLWYHFGSKDAPFQFSILGANIAYEAGRRWRENTCYTHMSGAYISYNSPQFGVEASGYIQLGKDTLLANIKSLMATLNLHYRPMEGLCINAGADGLTGGRSKDMKTSHNFNPLFGNHHKYYGNMDYFTPSYFTASYGSGLLDMHGGVDYSFGNVFDASAAYHYFTTTYDYGAKAFGLINLGHEIDINLNWRPVKDCTVSAGYGMAFLTRNSDLLLLGDHTVTQNWGYVSVNFTPQLLKHYFGSKHSKAIAPVETPIEPRPVPRAVFKEYE